MTIFLDDLPVSNNRVGYGAIGLRGRLGYEEKPVVCANEAVEHAVSAHGPSTVTYLLNKAYLRLTVTAAINEDIPRDAKAGGTFIILGDGQELTRAVVDNDNPQELSVDVSQVTLLTLVVQPTRFEYCHAVWVNPRLELGGESPFYDCLGRTTIDLKGSTFPVDSRLPRAIVTVVSPGFEDWLRDLIKSVQAVGKCDCPIIVLGIDDKDNVCRKSIEPFANVHFVPGRAVTPKSPGLKSCLYSVGNLFPNIEKFLCLDADMIVHADLSTIFTALDVASPSGVALVRDTIGPWTLREALLRAYKSSKDEFVTYFGEEALPLLDFTFVVNDGIFAGTGAALRQLDATIRNWTRANSWTYLHPKCSWRNQFVFNLALAAGQDILSLDTVYNVQLHKMAVAWDGDTPLWNSRPAKVLHFSGPAKGRPGANRRLPPSI